MLPLSAPNNNNLLSGKRAMAVNTPLKASDRSLENE